MKPERTSKGIGCHCEPAGPDIANLIEPRTSSQPSFLSWSVKMSLACLGSDSGSGAAAMMESGARTACSAPGAEKPKLNADITMADIGRTLAKIRKGRGDSILSKRQVLRGRG